MKQIYIVVNLPGVYGRKILKGTSGHNHAHPDWHLSPRIIADESALAALSSADGIIVQSPDEDLLQQIATLKVPMVNVSDMADPIVPSVFSDNMAIGRLAARHLLDRGLRNFSYVGSLESYFSRQRCEGFRQEVLAARPVVSFIEPLRGPEDIRLSADISPWLGSLPHPTGLMASDDSIARQVLHCCRLMNIRVPEDLAVIGVDDDDTIVDFIPLSSVAVNIDRISEVAMSMLAELIDGRQPNPSLRLIQPVEVVARKSTDVIDPNGPSMEQAMQFINAHAAERIRVEDVLEHLDVSRRWLEKRFRLIRGTSPAEEIRKAKIRQAQKLLITTDLAVAEVAIRSGFSDAFRMGAAFRKEVGMTPSAYRRDRRS